MTSSHYAVIEPPWNIITNYIAYITYELLIRLLVRLFFCVVCVICALSSFTLLFHRFSAHDSVNQMNQIPVDGTYYQPNLLENPLLTKSCLAVPNLLPVKVWTYFRTPRCLTNYWPILDLLDRKCSRMNVLLNKPAINQTYYRLTDFATRNSVAQSVTNSAADSAFG